MTSWQMLTSNYKKNQNQQPTNETKPKNSHENERRVGKDLKLNKQSILETYHNFFLADCCFNYVCRKEQVGNICLHPHSLTSWLLSLK